MKYVYVLNSKKDSKQIYIGCTADLKKRIEKHNLGSVAYTNKFRPWKVIVYIGFTDSQTAWRFEKYLKSHSGRAFLRKRLIK